jgi:hypothetical protein
MVSVPVPHIIEIRLVWFFLKENLVLVLKLHQIAIWLWRTWVLDLAVNFQLTSNIAPISSFSMNKKQNKILKNLGSNSTHKWNQESSSVSDSSKILILILVLQLIPKPNTQFLI